MVVGSLKADAPPLACDRAALQAHEERRSAPGPCCSRPRPIPARTKPILPAHDILRARFSRSSHHHRAAPCRARRRHRHAVRRAASGAPRRGRQDHCRNRRSISPTRWASWACSIAWRLSVSWAARWCRWAGTIRWSRRVLHCAVLAGPSPRQFRARPMRRSWVRKASASVAQQRRYRARGGAAACPIRQAPRAAGDAAARGAATLSGAVAKPSRALENLLGHARA